MISHFILDVGAAEICDMVIDVLYVPLFLHMEIDFQACWMLRSIPKASRDLLWMIEVRVVLLLFSNLEI